MASDSDPQLLPDGPDVDEGLAPPPDATDLPSVVVSAPAPAPLGRSWAFDFRGEAFLRSRGAPLETRGAQTLLGWIDKCLHTARGVLPIHPPGYGLVDPWSIFGRPVMELTANELEERFRDALTFHPRIADVQNLRLLRDPASSAVTAVYEVVTDPPTSDAALQTVRTSLEAA